MNHRIPLTASFYLLIMFAPTSDLYALEIRKSSATTSAEPRTLRLKTLRESEIYLQGMKSIPDAALKGRNRDFLLAGAFLGLGNSLSFVGDQDAAIEALNTQIRLEKKKGLGRPSRYQAGDDKLVSGAEAEDIVALDAISEIVKQAKNRQIVMLNEAHHVPMHRAFAMQLAKALRRIGYTYLACEAFSPWDEKPLAKKYVSDAMGLYTQEPMFANFINSAIEDGWKLISYEPTTANRDRNATKVYF